MQTVMSDFIILFPPDMPDGKSQRIADGMRRIFPEHTFEVSKEGPLEFNNTVLPITGKGGVGDPEDAIEMNLVEQEVVDIVQEAFAEFLNEAKKWLAR